MTTRKSYDCVDSLTHLSEQNLAKIKQFCSEWGISTFVDEKNWLYLEADPDQVDLVAAHKAACQRFLGGVPIYGMPMAVDQLLCPPKGIDMSRQVYTNQHGRQVAHKSTATGLWY